MIQQTIEEIEAKLRDSGAIKEEHKADLLSLLTTLKTEIAELSKTNVEDARSIAGFTDISAHEATRTEKNPQLLRLSISGLSASVVGFEKTHPRLVDIVNSICNTLSNLGI